MTIAVIYGGTRQNGNTELLTEQVVQGIVTEKIYLRDHTILPIEDMRHSQDGFQERNDDYNSILDRIMPHNILLFATPIYWYSMSGTMKNFIDRWSQTLRDPKYPDFKNKMASKKAFVIAVGGDDPTIKGLPMIQQFKHIFDFMGTDFEGYILGKGNKPEDIFQDKEALFAASQLNNNLKG
ncbi:flavodoxin family protein [Neobacillus pocheonensis]|uniref:Flavodoxin family protein n=1 Tax=Neobacillus pocheonensis TaxID=363869 RepID=A0ABT0WJV1_9BACI|nr:flavodoxin family protein [Neobacillus pocheonensis]